MKNIVIFASGNGTNAENIIRHFHTNQSAKVAAVFCNKPDAGVINKALNLGVETVVFNKPELTDGTVLSRLSQYSPQLIVLSGFLLHFPSSIISEYRGKIINIHPALLPKFGGKGMYGMNVHRAVIESADSETGITIHYVDEHYDQGDIIFQKAIPLSGSESCEEVAQMVRILEHNYFPEVIENFLKN